VEEANIDQVWGVGGKRRNEKGKTSSKKSKIVIGLGAERVGEEQNL